MAATYRIRFFFDHGSGICLWSGNDALLAACADRPVEHARIIHPDAASGVIFAALWRQPRETE